MLAPAITADKRIAIIKNTKIPRYSSLNKEMLKENCSIFNSIELIIIFILNYYLDL